MSNSDEHNPTKPSERFQALVRAGLPPFPPILPAPMFPAPEWASRFAPDAHAKAIDAMVDDCLQSVVDNVRVVVLQELERGRRYGDLNDAIALLRETAAELSGRFTYYAIGAGENVLKRFTARRDTEQAAFIARLSKRKGRSPATSEKRGR